MVSNNKHDNSQRTKTSLPGYARLPVNHCNLPAVILGSLTFQQHPTALYIDGIQELHKSLFAALTHLESAAERADYFMNYMVVHFRMHHLEDAGLIQGDTQKRKNADYLRMLRGWLFDADSREAAVLKSWVESRFGLLTRHHKGELKDFSGERYRNFQFERARGLYGTNALEAQIDLLYSYCQYELARRYKVHETITLYRGVNRIDSYEILQRHDKQHAIVLLNNLNSFTTHRERADEFGDYVLETSAPWQKILFYSDLLPGVMKGENEMLVVGGVYEVSIGL